MIQPLTYATEWRANGSEGYWFVIDVEKQWELAKAYPIFEAALEVANAKYHDDHRYFCAYGELYPRSKGTICVMPKSKFSGAS